MDKRTFKLILWCVSVTHKGSIS